MGPPAHPPADLELERARQSERARVAASIDVELQAACRSEAGLRRELGIAARALLAHHGYRRLGFVRLSDYARERLGVSARTLQSAAWLAARLETLPLVGSAFDRSELSWARARAVCSVAGPDDQAEWLERARHCSAETLAALAEAARPEGVFPADPDADDDGLIDDEPAVRLRIACPARVRALWRHALELASRVAGESLIPWRAAEVIAAEASSGRPAGASFGDRALLVAMRLARRARRLASGVARQSHAAASSTATTSDAAPSTAAPQTFAPSADPSTAAPPAITAAIAATRMANAPYAPAPTCAAPAAFSSTVGFGAVEQSANSMPGRCDPFALDARLVDAVRAIQTIEPRIGRLLRLLVDHRLYQALGFRSVDAYVRERLGISVRKAWALLKVEKSIRRAPAFARGYEAGRLSWVRALTLLPVVDRENAEAWIARAASVTVRRLADEVNWVLETRDALGPHVPLDPPALDRDLSSVVTATLADERPETSSDTAPQNGTCPVPAETGARECEKTSSDTALQIGAHPLLIGGPAGECQKMSLDTALQIGARSEVRDAEIQLTAPASVVALLRDTLDAFARADEPRWTALERVLRHVIGYWESTPRHRDPVFARDGWRCLVPACSSRSNLHDHHVRYRSRGGGNERWNRSTICASHHLHGIHRGAIRGWGRAPRGIHWELGVRAGAPPLLSYVGDRICNDGCPDLGKSEASAAFSSLSG